MSADKISNLAHKWAIQTYMKGLGRRCDIDAARDAFSRELDALTSSHQRLKEALAGVVASWDQMSHERERFYPALVHSEAIAAARAAITRQDGSAS